MSASGSHAVVGVDVVDQRIIFYLGIPLPVPPPPRRLLPLDRRPTAWSARAAGEGGGPAGRAPPCRTLRLPAAAASQMSRRGRLGSCAARLVCCRN